MLEGSKYIIEDNRQRKRKEFDERLSEAERELSTAKKRLETKRNELIRRRVSQEQINKTLVNYNQEVNFWAEELLKRKGDLEKYLQAERKQTSLFGFGTLGISFDYFNASSIHDLNDLKKQYRKLALINHPDKGGNVEVMQKINEEYNYLFNKIINGQKFNDDELNIEVEVDEKYKEIIEQLTRFSGLNIEVIGSWIWISGNTYPIRKELKELGFRFAGKKKMWYWHSDAYKKKTKKHYSVDELRKFYGTVKYKNKKKKELGAIEVLNQNKIRIASFKGFKPTYNENLNFSSYIKRCQQSKVIHTKGDLYDTINYIKKAINNHSCEVKELAKVLQGDNIAQTVFNIWHFLRPRNLGGQVNYHLDTPGVEEIRTPARSWEDRFNGIDCEDLAIFAGSILKNLNIGFNLRIVGFFGGPGYQHIFVAVPTEHGQMILDPVMKMKFNELPKNITSNMEISYMSGIAGINDPVMQAIEKIAQKDLSGLGDLDDSKQIVETAKNIERLAKIKEAQAMLFFASIDDQYTNNLGKFSFHGLWDKLKDKANNLVKKIKNVNTNIRHKASDLWHKATSTVKKGWDYYKKYGFAPIRGAFLLLLRVNFFSLAKKLYVGYIETQDAKRYNLNLAEYNKAKSARIKFENFWKSMGGNIDALKKAVTEGRAKKKFEKKLTQTGIHGLGAVGVDDATVATAAATTAPFWTKIITWFKGINWDNLFSFVDKAKSITGEKKNNDEGQTSMDKVSSAENDETGDITNKKSFPMWLPLAFFTGLVLFSN